MNSTHIVNARITVMKKNTTVQSSGIKKYTKALKDVERCD